MESNGESGIREPRRMNVLEQLRQAVAAASEEPERPPEATAVRFRDQSLTYRALNSRANALAPRSAQAHRCLPAGTGGVAARHSWLGGSRSRIRGPPFRARADRSRSDGLGVFFPARHYPTGSRRYRRVN